MEAEPYTIFAYDGSGANTEKGIITERPPKLSSAKDELHYYIEGCRRAGVVISPDFLTYGGLVVVSFEVKVKVVG